MTEIENRRLHVLRELRAGIEALDDKVATLGENVDRGFSDVRSRMDDIRQAVHGESVLGRYAASEVDERLDALEKRVSRLEEAQ